MKVWLPDNAAETVDSHDGEDVYNYIQAGHLIDDRQGHLQQNLSDDSEGFDFFNEY